MSHHLMQKSSVITAQKKSDIPNFYVGSVVSVHYKIIEGNKSRVQIFTGLVINRHNGNNLDASFTVLKNSVAGIKVSRVFPLHSPSIEKIIVVTLQRARRANIRNIKQRKDPIRDVRAKLVKAA